jgi:uncharacterized oligopeptide transporter (OPT) family protein
MNADRGFSARAIGVGVAVGAVGAVSNLYVSLKTGWSLPVMTTAAMVGLAVARSQKRELRAREAVVLSSLASAAGYMAGGGNAAAIPALVMLGGTAPAPLAMAAWFATIALLGTLCAPLLGRRIVQDLRFPTATATATLVQASRGQTTSGGIARALQGSALFGASVALIRSAARLPPTVLLPGRAGAFTFGMDTSFLLVGAGGLMTARTAWSTLLGALLTYAVVAPALVARAIVVEPSYRSIVRFMVWPAASLLIASAVTELALLLPRLLKRGSAEAMADRRWAFVLGLSCVAVALERMVFGIPWAVAVLALPAALGMAYVAGRAMGETDVVPTKALAPIAQLGAGVAASGLAAPAMVPNLTSGVALHAADTLGSMKASELLGTPPREALIARVIGCLIGAVVVVIAYQLVVPDARALPTAELPAPGVLIWKSVLEVVTAGEVPFATRVSVGIGAALGIVLSILDRALPKRITPWLPSAMGLGSGMVLPASSSIAIALGGLARAACDRRRGTDTSVALASGLVAGESVVGVAMQVLAVW